ncbi:MAG: hypothetical protein ACHQAY_15295 [Hyphomicrobiales bacterium]
MTQSLRIFISSPGDVPEERLRANLVVQKLARDYARFFRIEPYLWEYEPMLASGHFQDAIEPPSASDIVVLIVYSRLGTSLPKSTSVREYRGLDGRAPVTGTEWEFEEALAAHRANGAPDLLAYRKLGDPGASLVDSARRAEQERQWNALEQFWRLHFEGAGLFIAGSSKFHSLDEFDQKLEADLAHLIERRIAQLEQVGDGAAEGTWLRGSPFRGLAAYDFDDAPVFFGRDAQIREALTRLQGAAQQGCAFLLVLGASGSGKSSLARAGLLPALFAPKAVPGVGVWRRATMRPGEGDEDPLLGLARALAVGHTPRGLGLPELLGKGSSVEDFAAHLAAAPDDPSFPLRVALDRVASEARSTQGLLPHETARLVLLVDQLEELFTRRIDAGRRDLFLRVLSGLARSGLVWVVATMRNDLWHRAVEAPHLVALVEAGARLDLLRPDAAQIIEIIRRPAAAAGLSFEADAEHGVGLDAVISRAAAEEPGVLPLLSVMLDELYARDMTSGASGDAPRRVLRFATYRELGELKGAIAKRADEAMHALAATDPEAAAAFPRVLRALVTTSAGGDAVTSRPANLDGFPPGGPEARLIAALLAPSARLLVAAAHDGSAELRLAHEALIDNWPMARRQIKLDYRDLETRARLEALQRRWSGAAPMEERRRTLLAGLNLAEGTDLVRRWNMDRSSGLGAFVQASERADAWRRRRALIAASVLLFVFAGIAGIAGLQWQRAEAQAETARSAQRTEMEARASAETQRARAAESEQRALQALRSTKLQTAQTLATEAQLATRQHDARRALALAIEAGETERDALAPGEVPASEQALLGALSGVREVVHIQGSIQNWWVPYAFLDDATLVYADGGAGIVAVDLRHEAKVVARVALPVQRAATQLAVLPDRRIAAVTAIQDLFLFDLRSQELMATIPFQERIASLDIEPTKHLAVAASGNSISIIDLDRPGAPLVASIPESSPDIKVGQARFAASGTKILVSYGVKLYAFDLGTHSFSGQIGEMSGQGIGGDTALLQSAVADGRIPFVHLVPDLGQSLRFFTVAPLELQAFDAHAGGVRSLARDDHGFLFEGVGVTDIDRKGAPKQSVVVLAKSKDDRLEFELHFLGGEKGLEAGDDKLQPAFESFTVPPGDFAHQKPDSCKVSPEVSFLACQYWSKDLQGIVVWRLMGGAHRFERIAERPFASSVVASGVAPGRLLMSSLDGFLSVANGVETKMADLPPGWQLTAAEGPFVVGLSGPTRQGRIWRLAQADAQPTSVLGPIAAYDIRIAPDGSRSLIRGPEGLAMIDLSTSQRVWSAPIASPQAAVLSADGGRVIALTDSAVYLLDAASGRIMSSYPLTLQKDAPAAVDATGQELAFLDSEKGVLVMDLRSGATTPVGEGGPTATRFAWVKTTGTLLIGRADGSVLAWEMGKGHRWLVASPFDQSFQASALPNQPPQGVVVQLALSHDERRFAVIRQDIRTIDIHDLGDGRHLTALTPPSAVARVPLDVSFAQNGTVLASWGFGTTTDQIPIYVTAHRLPLGFEAALAAAKARFAELGHVWDGSRPNEPAATVK